MKNPSNIDILQRTDPDDYNRTCAQCGKPFIKQVNGGGYKYCSRACMKASKRAWDRDPVNKARRHIYYLNYRYGIDKDQFRAMHAAQNGLCAICRTSIEYGGSRKGMHLDHCHNTGKPRGLLCARCNGALAGFRDDIELLKRAIEYLK